MNSLKSLTLPSTIKYIDFGTFFSCGQLETINGWDPAKIERMGASTITSASNKIWSDPGYVREEDGFKYMGDILILMPNSETITIEEGARIIVRSATGIPACKHIDIPSTAEAISSGVLYNCTLLETCTIHAVTPPLIYNAYDVSREENATWLRSYYASTSPDFGPNPTPADVKYYVPKEALAAYKASDKWNMLDLRPIGGWTVTFLDGNGNPVDVQQVEQGETPVAPTTGIEKDPTTEQVFAWTGEWDKALAAVTEDVTYTATFNASPRPYTVKFVNYDGTTELDNQVINYGSTITYGGTTPTREQDAQYKYTFNGWDPAFEDGVTTVTGDMTFTATYSTITQKYAVAFYPSSADAVNGTNAYVQKHIAYGSDLKAIEAEAMGASSFAIPECYKLLGWTTNGIDLYALTTVSEAVKLFPLWNTNATFSVIFKNRANDAIIDTYDNVDCHWEATAPTSDVEGKHWEWESDEWKSVTKDLVIYGSLVENGGTGIDDVQGNGGQCTKVMIDGQLYIILGEHMYDAQGKMVK